MANVQEQPTDKLVPQRDLQIVVQGSRNITTQIASISKVPAFNPGAQILVVLGHARQEVIAFHAGARQGLAAVHADLQEGGAVLWQEV